MFCIAGQQLDNSGTMTLQLIYTESVTEKAAGQQLALQLLCPPPSLVRRQNRGTPGQYLNGGECFSHVPAEPLPPLVKGEST